ncbi:MAG: hypothetical protein Q8J76_07160, partial [Desulfobulbaceae bacterium]|nr:hypothetical protein [Desulfobulbaceae bacterium]
QRHPKAKPVIIGYARPIANGDERIVTLDLLAKKLGFERGEHLTLAFEIEQEIFKKTKERMNLLAYVLPFLCDQGYSPQEIYRLLSALVYAGVVACYGETADQPGESFFPLQCNDIYYQGKSTRKIPSNTDLRP